ncbi:hypothetical protein [Falsiporphyromonas endometrii]|uniref:Secreted protein n=1 Tax=Falsiporphyromonas endometrii TaxID=1387297 RepID=A0ABV9K5S3_9PORP
MGILILLTVFLILVQLGGSHLREARVCSIDSEQIAFPAITKINHPGLLILWAVKLIERGFNLLKTVSLHFAIKATQTTPIQTQNHKFEG